MLHRHFTFYEHLNLKNEAIIEDACNIWIIVTFPSPPMQALEIRSIF